VPLVILVEYSSNIIATEYDDTEDETKDKLFTAKVYSDTIWKESSLKLMMAIRFEPASK